MMLALASPAAAQGRTAGGGETNAKAQKRADARQSILQRRDRLPDLPQASLVAGRPPPMLGTVPVSEDASVGVGLFSVVGATEKELVRRRTDPTYTVRPRDGRVAAVGFQLRF
jgi:hypothetical protein